MRKTSGISLIILIFLSLCLVTFSLLSLTSATADYRLSEKSAARTTAYYAADTAANQVLAEIDRFLFEILSARPDETIFYQSCNDCFSDQVTITLDNDAASPVVLYYDPETLQLSYAVPFTDKQSLAATVALHYPQSPEDTFYVINTWKVVNDSVWMPDNSLPVYQRPDS